MVTPYPPIRDGIATYAAQSVRGLRAEGHDVEVLSPGPSAAHYHLDLVGNRGALALGKRLPRYDKVIVQFHPDFFYPLPSSVRDRVEVGLALTAAFRLAHEVEVVVHEIDYRHGRLRSPDGYAARALWHSVDRILVHTEGERRDFAKAFGVSPKRVQLAPHGALFVRNTRYDRVGARETLDIPIGSVMFLAIGFIQESKGFDRAIAAFTGLGARGARLDVVGRSRLGEGGDGYENHVDVMAAATAGVHRHKGFVSDELFDRWIVASDVVVLPYRNVWSSGVLERASLYGKEVIATRIGGLAEQAAMRTGMTFVRDDEGLRRAMWSRVTGRDSSPKLDPWPVEGAELRGQIQRQIRHRALASRGSRVTGRASASGSPAGSDAVVALAGAVSAPVRRVGELALPPITSQRSGAAFVKSVVRRLTAWELGPIVGEVNALRAATIEGLEAVGAEAGSTSVRLNEAAPRFPSAAAATHGRRRGVPGGRGTVGRDDSDLDDSDLDDGGPVGRDGYAGDGFASTREEEVRAVTNDGIDCPPKRTTRF